MFLKIYNKILLWGKAKNSVKILSLISFIEAIFFPIPPDLVLLPMCLASPKRAFYYAGLTTLCSVLGGIIGYIIGVLAFDAINVFMIELGYEEHILRVQEWFETWGIWVIFMAGFSPIPYKVFTIIAGASLMPFLGFVVASFFGRGARFFLIALFVILGGEVLQRNISKNIEYIGWFVFLPVCIFIFFNIFTQ